VGEVLSNFKYTLEILITDKGAAAITLFPSQPFLKEKTNLFFFIRSFGVESFGAISSLIYRSQF
jgi:hypothetical protein